MKLYINTKTLTLEDGVHEIVLSVSDEYRDGHDFIINSDKLIKEDEKFIVREQDTWDSFPLYEIVNDELVDFDYSSYSYFTGTKRRKQVSKRITQQFNPSAEAKILRTTLKYIMNTLDIKYPNDFTKYNSKIEEIINKNLKGK